MAGAGRARAQRTQRLRPWTKRALRLAPRAEWWRGNGRGSASACAPALLVLQPLLLLGLRAWLPILLWVKVRPQPARQQLQQQGAGPLPRAQPLRRRLARPNSLALRKRLFSEPQVQRAQRAPCCGGNSPAGPRCCC